MSATITIVGAGAWGTALALNAARNGDTVDLWHRDPATIDHMVKHRVHPNTLGSVTLPANILPTHDISCVETSDCVVLAVPSQAIQAVAKRFMARAKAGTPFVITAKGFQLPEGRLLSNALAETAGEHPIAILSGPTFAVELASGKPAAATLACDEAAMRATLAAMLSSRGFRLYSTDDVIGAQVGGAVKNVLAIACGIAIGHGLGENARAALVTRGMAEIARLNQALGGRSETLMGLSGIGDIMLTCSSDQSRNFAFGRAIGAAGHAAPVLADPHALVEGLTTTQAVAAMAKNHGLDMPLASAVYAILYDDRPVQDVVTALLQRPLRTEDSSPA